MSALTRIDRARKAFLAAPLFAVAVVWVVLDDLFRSFVAPVVAWLAGLRPFRRIERWISRLPPYPTMALFLVPLAVIEPFKLFGLYLVAKGHWLLGILAFVAAKTVGLGIAERLFAVSRDKLLAIGWFAWVHASILAIRDAVHAYLAETRLWPALMGALAAVKASIWAAKDRVRGFLRRSDPPGPLARRFETARRAAASYLHAARSRGGRP